MNMTISEAIIACRFLGTVMSSRILGWPSFIADSASMSVCM